MTSRLPDLRGLNVVDAKARLAALNVNAVVAGRTALPPDPAAMVREQLAQPGTEYGDDGDYYVVLMTTHGRRPHG